MGKDVIYTSDDETGGQTNPPEAKKKQKGMDPEALKKLRQSNVTRLQKARFVKQEKKRELERKKKKLLYETDSDDDFDLTLTTIDKKAANEPDELDMLKEQVRQMKLMIEEKKKPKRPPTPGVLKSDPKPEVPKSEPTPEVPKSEPTPMPVISQAPIYVGPIDAPTFRWGNM